MPAPCKLPSPTEIKRDLDRYVIGQDDAKVALAVTAYNHLKRIRQQAEGIEKSNVLLLGPTGTGKTLLVRTLAQSLCVPYVTADATALTEAGYQGSDVYEMLARLLTAAGGDVALAERGIVYVDEIDKLARPPGHPGRDVSGEGVQQGLLKMLEGDVIDLPGPRSSSPHVQLNTRDILFICGGAFEALLRHKSLAGLRTTPRPVGFLAPETPPVEPPQPEGITAHELVAYGMLPELLGRLPVVVQTHPLTVADLMRVLTEPENALATQYRRLLELDGVELEFTPAGLERIAREAFAQGAGARGLRSVLERILRPVMFAGPAYRGQRVTVTAEWLGEAEPQQVCAG